MNVDFTSLWQDCLIQLEDKVSASDLSTWFRPLQADVRQDAMLLYASNRFIKQHVDSNYLALIIKTAQHLTGNSEFSVSVVEGDKPIKVVETKSAQSAVVSEPENQVQVAFRSNLNPNYFFENFVEGKSNQMAKAISQQVADENNSYNPLFLYGGTGLGKTHLLHAIGNEILRRKPDAKVLYIHSERFVQEMVKALRTDSSEKFKKFYRTLDALLIDDIQFFAGKDGSQEEFFHTFNSLFDAGRKIILTSDRYPKEIEKVEERLKSRFGWGVSISIEPPELETRVAILMKKAEEKNFRLPQEVAFFIGQKLRTNVRELEGALSSVYANAQFRGEEITIDFVRETLKDRLALQDKLVTIENIQKVVAEYYRIKVSDLKSKSRSRAITRPRQLAMALARELTNRSLPEIGKSFGDRDHTTVLHACQKVVDLRKEDSSIQEDWSNLVRTLSV